MSVHEPSSISAMIADGVVDVVVGDEDATSADAFGSVMVCLPNLIRFTSEMDCSRALAPILLHHSVEYCLLFRLFKLSFYNIYHVPGCHQEGQDHLEKL